GARLQGRLLRRAGQTVWAFSLLSLLPALADAEPVPRLLFLNARALPLLVSALASGWMAVVARPERPVDPGSGEGSQASREDELSPAYAAAAVLVGTWLIAQETYRGFDWRHAPSSTTWQASAIFAIASLWAI